MKHPLRSLGLSLAFGAAAVVATTAFIAPGWLLPQALAATDTPKLKVETAPVGADLRARTSLAPVVRKVTPSVVNIYTAKTVQTGQQASPLLNDPLFRQFFGIPSDRIPRERQERSLGSGVIVTADGYILTNNHVVEGADEIKVALADERTIYDAKIIGTDPQTDIAVIKIEDGGKLPAITLTDSDALEVGDLVIAIGNPFGIGQTVTTGIVSAKSRGGMGILDYEDFIQTDASINPGNSGGALVDAEGRLVGVNTAIMSRSGGSSGVGFAVPVNIARHVLERIVTEGKVTRGYLGVSIQQLTPELAKEFNLPENTGALVGEVTLRSPAERAGLKDGDVIVELNGRKVTDSRNLRLIISQTTPGTAITLKLIREGKEMTVTAKLDELPSGGLNRSGSGGLRRGDGGDAFDGVTVDELDARARRQFGIPNQIRGVLVTEVEPDSAAANAGLQAGDVIFEINRQRVGSVDEAVEVSRQLQGERILLRVWTRGVARYLVIDPARVQR